MGDSTWIRIDDVAAKENVFPEALGQPFEFGRTAGQGSSRRPGPPPVAGMTIRRAIGAGTTGQVALNVVWAVVSFSGMFTPVPPRSTHAPPELLQNEQRGNRAMTPPPV